VLPLNNEGGGAVAASLHLTEENTGTAPFQSKSAPSLALIASMMAAAPLKVQESANVSTPTLHAKEKPSLPLSSAFSWPVKVSMLLSALQILFSIILSLTAKQWSSPTNQVYPGCQNRTTASVSLSP
jgi:hypothetical protein